MKTSLVPPLLWHWGTGQEQVVFSEESVVLDLSVSSSSSSSSSCSTARS